MALWSHGNNGTVLRGLKAFSVTENMVVVPHGSILGPYLFILFINRNSLDTLTYVLMKLLLYILRTVSNTIVKLEERGEKYSGSE